MSNTPTVCCFSIGPTDMRAELIVGPVSLVCHPDIDPDSFDVCVFRVMFDPLSLMFVYSG